MVSLIQTIMLACGPLFGIWLGSRLTRAREDREWRRDRCLETYTDILAACESVTTEAHRLYLELADPTDQLGILVEKIAALHRATQRAALLAPKEMMSTLYALSAHTNTEIATRSGVSPKLSLNEWRKITTTDLAAIAAQFTKETRNDLEIHFPLRVIDRCRKMLHRSE